MRQQVISRFLEGAGGGGASVKIVLTGYRGTGKSSVGRALASLLRLPFIDTDEEIEEREHRSIGEIFRNEGEAYFRRREREVIRALRDKEGVIATGGGVVLDPENVEHLRAHGDIFLLYASERTIRERIMNSDRPPLTDLGFEGEVSALLERRKIHYLSAADFCINTDEGTVEEICHGIRRITMEGSTGISERERALRFRVFQGLPPAEMDALETALLRPPRQTVRLCAIAGYPVRHSKSPHLYMHLFQRYSLNYHYTRLEDPEISRIMQCFGELDMRGLSVTIPFKKAVIGYLDEVSREAEEIGAVNTVIQCGGRRYGFNTDWVGVREPLRGHSGERAVVIGAGGAAAAAAYAALSLGMDVHILNRTIGRAKELAARLGCSSGSLDDLESISAGVIVNATPVGMNGEDRTPVKPDCLRKGMTIFDLVYTPPDTHLIRIARKKGCETIAGTEMFVHQAVEQFRLFTGIRVTPDSVREYLT
ncbi:MAG: shikimate dehydrogenase [Methanomicrobiales archaeon]|nr:shikimate dehydrogenase [Methanomicrobiales archaeon]